LQRRGLMHPRRAGDWPLVTCHSATNGRGLINVGQLAPNCWSLAGGRLAVACRPNPAVWQTASWSPTALHFFQYFWYLKKIKIGFLRKFGNGSSIWGEWMYNTPIFLNFAPTLGRVKSSILLRAWRFHIFPIFSKIRVYQDLHMNCWDFCLMKKWIHFKFLKSC
jgi:hypothetical protein